jgi:peptidoglycan hydrolase-like protein with peptidoglycan-binding domain
MKNQKKSGYRYLVRFTHRQVQMMIVVLAVAIAGVWTLLLSSAATPSGVRFVLLCPPSGYTCTGSTSTLSSYATQIKNYYQTRIGSGHTFVLKSVTMIRAPYAPSYYWIGNTGSYQTTTNRLAAAVGVSPNDGTNGVKTVVMTGFHVFDHCGVSVENGAMAVGDPVQGCSSYEGQVLAHELGHSFGLAHSGNYPGDALHRTDGSLMHAPMACNYTSLASCPLNSTDRAFLINYRLAWFPVQSTSTTTTTTTSSANPYTAYCPTGGEATVGFGYTTSGNCVKKLQWDLNKIQNAGLTVDGAFGNLTKSAVVKFQSNHGLTADGICGKNTWSKLDSYYK